MPILDLKTIHATVVVVDLIGYSSIARSLEQNSGAHNVLELNLQIQSFVEAGIVSVAASRSRNLIKTTGDGGILLFDSAEQAHRFCTRFQEVAFEHSSTKTERSAQRWFRVGVSTGELSWAESNGQLEYAGTTIADAVRLEAASGAGEVLIDRATWSALPQSLQVFYDQEETVAGKRDEKFPARRYRVVRDSPRIEKHEALAATRGPAWDKRRRVLLMMEALQTDADLGKLIWLVEMPIALRPSQQAALNHQRSEILHWADTIKGCGVDVLLSSLEVVLSLDTAAIEQT